MSFSLKPDYVFDDYAAVTPAFLHAHGAVVHELDDTPLTDLGGAVITSL